MIFPKGTPLKRCVAFRTRISDFVIEVSWRNGDDYDIEITEPDSNFVISSSSGKSPFGGVYKAFITGCDGRSGDMGLGKRGIRKSLLLYPLSSTRSPLGEYKVVVRLKEKCDATMINVAKNRVVGSLFRNDNLHVVDSRKVKNVAPGQVVARFSFFKISF